MDCLTEAISLAISEKMVCYIYGMATITLA